MLKVFLTLTMFAAACFAQVDTGTIVGTITDASGAAMAGIAVTITNTATGIKTAAMTGERGQFVSPPLRPGPYTVAVEAPGFKRSVTELTLNLNDRAAANMVLQLGAASEQVTVTAEAPLLQSESATVSTLQDEESIQGLPMNTRNINQLFAIAPGVVPGDTQSTSVALTAVRGDTQNSVNGLSFRSNRFLVDGLDNSENHNGRGIMMYPPVDAIMEFRVQTSSANAEFGRGGGGAINLYYKTGSNEIHGNMFEFLRNSALDARNYFATGTTTPPFRMNQFGATLGGPIKKNSTFFFFSYDGQQRRQALTYNPNVPLPAYKTGDFSSIKNKIYDPLTQTGTGNAVTRSVFAGNIVPANRIDKVGKTVIALYPDPNGAGTTNNYTSNPSQSNSANSFDVKIDPRLSPRDQTFFRYSHHNSEQNVPGPLPLPAVGGANAYASSKYPMQQFVGSYTRTVTSTQVNEFRAGVTRLRIDSLNPNYGNNVSDQVGIPGVNAGADPTHSGLTQITLSGFQNLGDPPNAPAIIVSENYQINDNYTAIKGNHTIKFGGEFTRRHYNLFQFTSTHGTLSFGPVYTTNPSSASGTGYSLADLLLGKPASGNIDFANGTRGYRRKEFGLYVQDTWKVTPSLTLNYGLRYDLFLGYPWSEVAGRMTNFRSDLGQVFLAGTPQIPWASGAHTNLTNFGPRLGISYKLTRQTVLRGGYGLFYSADAISGQNLGGANPPFVGAYSFSNNSLDFPGARPLSAGFANLALATGSSAISGIDPYFKTPMAQQWNVGIQQGVGKTVAFTLSYVGTTGKHLMVTPDVNQPIPGAGAVAARRPYPAFSGISIYHAEGASIYHSLQATATKRLATGFNLQMNYTYAHAIDTGDFQSVPQNSSNLRAERGSSSSDLRHRVVVTWIYSLPFLRKNRYLGGWQLSGLSNMYTGTPFTPTSSTNTLNIGSSTQRPDRIASGVLDNPTVQRWFDIGAFATPAQYRFGNSGRNILYGPGTMQFDAALMKNFILREGKPWRAQFRAEAFNIANTPQLNNPNASIGSNGAGIISNAGSPATFQRTSRQIQFALKLYW
jgi:outer membrane receptor protein involved in Fe transport